MADFRGEKTVTINVRTTKPTLGVRGGSQGASTVIEKVEVPQSFQFLHNIEFSASRLADIRRLPVHERGKAIYGSIFIKGQQQAGLGSERLKSNLLDMDILMKRGLTIEQMTGNLNKYRSAQNRPGGMAGVQFHDSPSIGPNLQANELNAQGMGAIAATIATPPAMKALGGAIGGIGSLLSRVHWSLPYAGATTLGGMWLYGAKEGKGPATVPNWLLGRRGPAGRGFAGGFSDAFEVASEAMMLGDLAKGIGSIFRGFGFGSSQTVDPGTGLVPYGPRGGGFGGGRGRPNQPNGPSDPNVIDAEWRYVDRVTSSPVSPPPNMPSPKPPGPPVDRSRKKFFNLLQSMRKPSEDLGVFGQSRKIYEKFQNATSDAERELIRREFANHLNMLKNSIPDLTTRTYKSKSALASGDIRSLPDGEFILRVGEGQGSSRFAPYKGGRKDEFGIELQWLMDAMGVEFKFDQATVTPGPAPESQSQAADQPSPQAPIGPSPSSPTPQPQPQPKRFEAGESRPFAEPERPRKLEGVDEFGQATGEIVPVDRARGELAPKEQVKGEMAARKQAKGELAQAEKAKLDIAPKDLVNVGEAALPKGAPAIPPPRVPVKVVGKFAEPAPKPGGWNWNFRMPSFGVPEDEQLPFKRYMGNFLPVAPSFHSAKIRIPGHIINSGRLDYGD